MNGSKTYKFLWWSYGSNATRSTFHFFKTLFEDFYNYSENHCDRPSHDMNIPDNFSSDCIIACNVRNPYTQIVSHFNDLKEFDNSLVFSEWLIGCDGVDIFRDPGRWKVAGSEPDIFIHMESLEEDLVNLPFVKEWISKNESSDEIVETALDSHIRRNNFLDESGHDKYIDGFQSINGMYTQELADKVISLTSGEEYFKQLGYDIDSWH